MYYGLRIIKLLAAVDPNLVLNISKLFQGNPFVKQEIWGWLSEVLPEAKSLPKDELIACLGILYADVEARLVFNFCYADSQT